MTVGSDECAIFSLSYNWREEYVCSSGAAHMPGVLVQLRESFTCRHTHTGVHIQFCRRILEVSLVELNVWLGGNQPSNSQDTGKHISY